MNRLFQSESKFLERARVALTNAKSHQKINPLLAEYSMDEARIDLGWEKYNKAKESWEYNQQENAEAKIASNSYKKEYEDIETIFKIHREKTLTYFKKQFELLIRLGLEGPFPTGYREFFDKSKRFYQTIKDNSEIQEKLSLIKVSSDVVHDCLLKHASLLAKRADYEKESGESQEATQSKNAAMLELKDWMEDFDNIAKVALYEEPQLLEALGIFVRS